MTPNKSIGSTASYGASREYFEDHWATEDKMRAESHASAVKASAIADDHRARYWQAREDEWARDRRREAGLTRDDYDIVEYFLRLFRWVDNFRVAGRIPEALGALIHADKEVDRLDEPDQDGTQRLYAFAVREANARHRYNAEKQLLKPGYSAFVVDARLGYFRHIKPVAPAGTERTEPEPSEGLRADAAGDCDPIDAIRCG
jgi:hypothetical protein